MIRKEKIMITSESKSDGKFPCFIYRVISTRRSEFTNPIL